MTSPARQLEFTYEAHLDRQRLGTLLDLVERLMSDSQWRTLGEIHAAIQRGSEAGISARLRDLRKQGRTVDRRRRGNPTAGLFEYRLLSR